MAVGGWYPGEDPRAIELFLELQRKMTPVERLLAAARLTEDLRLMSEAFLRSRFPGASGQEIFLWSAARRLDRETMISVYGWDPACCR